MTGYATGPLPERVTVLVVGAGFSGLAAIKAFVEDGTDFAVIERREELGGTWWDNRYPGVACDVASNLYSFSFEPNPHWTRTFADGPQIHRYMEHCADKYDLRRHIHVDTELTDATWSEAEQLWEVTTSRGSIKAQFLILGTGPLSEPTLPAGVEGIETFTGQVLHTAQWDSSVDLTDKHVLVVGTGASAVQLIPEAAKVASKVTVLQRTAPWVFPKGDRPVTRFERWLYRNLPFTQRFVRLGVYLGREAMVPGLTRFGWLLRPIEGYSWLQRRIVVKDAEKRAKLTPDYRLGCKRILPSNTFYKAMNRTNVDLITSPLKQVEGSDIITADGDRVCPDVLVLATGFNVTQPKVADLVHGTSGTNLGDLWRKESMQALRGLTVHGFPNLFHMLSANTAVGHTSVIYLIEGQIEYIRQALSFAKTHQLGALEASSLAQDGWTAMVQARMPSTIWVQGGCASWYHDDHGRVTTLWPATTMSYRWKIRHFRPEEYIATASVS